MARLAMTRVIISGSFHREPDQLQRIFRELETNGCRILSPVTLDFIALGADFVRTTAETGLSDLTIEQFHLRALRDADFVWLHAPAGYIGVGAAFEIGFAHALNIPVFSFVGPNDPIIKPRVTVVKSVFEALEIIGDTH